MISSRAEQESVLTFRFPYPDAPNTEMVLVAYQHVNKWYLHAHKHVINETGSQQVPRGLHTANDHEFSIDCRDQAIALLAEQGIAVDR